MIPQGVYHGHMGGILFYDGNCGLCHGAVRFALARDRHARFRFAPLGGVTFQRLLPDPPPLPDSLVLLQDGGLFTRSEAILRILEGLGGGWGLLGVLGRACPARLRDGLYDLIARNRGRWFRRPEASCPRVAPGLGTRLLP